MTPAITVRNPAIFSLIVDLGRTGFGAVGVPSSSALDRYACQALYCLLDCANAPLLEVIGPKFALQFDADVICAITGARVMAFLDDAPLRPWTSFRAKKGSLLLVKEVTEGFRYYIGFAGKVKAEAVMGSYTTNLECRFGGLNGTPLKSGDILHLEESREIETNLIPLNLIPSMNSPHILRVMEGPEADSFTADSCRHFWEKGYHELFTVSTNLNRTGIRLDGTPLVFKPEAPKSIVSEGIVPGTIQIPGDGLPIIMLNERTIGGYARVAVIARADQDRLAHLKANDLVCFERIIVEEGERLWRDKQKRITQLQSLTGSTPPPGPIQE
ncbi:MAG: biotin-dependent carboxyltransferase family protein [Deltaproteobacteria bacterium]|nr:biotin-dependent carboxyltransferase family protein [Deltaproteobacteria bacterium]